MKETMRWGRVWTYDCPEEMEREVIVGKELGSTQALQNLRERSCIRCQDVGSLVPG